METFEEFLTMSFAHGVYSRELRLTREEAGYVQNKYPTASVKMCTTPEASDGKCWYEINLLPPIAKTGEIVSLQNENLRLKQELEALKKWLIPAK